MSQVVVTKDNLSKKRELSRAQEAKISREDMFGRWRRNDISGKDPVAAAIALVLSPVVAAWAALTGFIYLVLTILKWIFKGLGKIAGGTKSLITGESLKGRRGSS